MTTFADYKFVDSVLQKVFKTSGTRNSDPKVYPIPFDPLAKYNTGIAYWLLDSGEISLGTLMQIPIPKNLSPDVYRQVQAFYKRNNRLYLDSKVSCIMPNITAKVDIKDEAEIAGFATGYLDKVEVYAKQQIAALNRVIKILSSKS